MREARFIKNNAEKWKRFQNEDSDDPDVLAERFTSLIDDLSYSKTFYPKSRATKWINGITSSIYQNVYRNKREKLNRIFDFWKFELPILFQKYHNIFLITTITFITFVVFGILLSDKDPEFVRTILGDKYVEMTERNIAKGDPFGVYRDGNPFSMFVMIGVNNIRVAFLQFISGFSLGFFTIKILWSNGIMLGCFQYLFFQHELGLKSILVIWIHGTIEIASVIIAATSGLIVAYGILFPKTYTRYQSFRKAIKDAAKILIALIPFFIVAAFLESYITHLMSNSFGNNKEGGIPAFVSVIILISSFAFIIWYFVLLPKKLKRKGLFLKKSGIIEEINSSND